MDDGTTIAQIKAFIGTHPPPKLPADAMLSSEDFLRLGYTPRIVYPVASESDADKTEEEIGFPIPALLRRLYLEVSNGIAGFGYDIIGLKGGCAASPGTLVLSYLDLKAAFNYSRRKWRPGLLPFCDWGCCSLSCVDCSDPAAPVLTYDPNELSEEGYSLREFFGMWVKGKVHRSEGVVVTKKIINPFAGKKTTVHGRRTRRR